MSLPNEPGAWVRWSDVIRLLQLRLAPPSRWPVLLAVLLTSCRYGGRDARLSVEDIAMLTGLSEKTVKTAIKELVAMGIVTRTKRFMKLKVTLQPFVESVPSLPPDTTGF